MPSYGWRRQGSGRRSSRGCEAEGFDVDVLDLVDRLRRHRPRRSGTTVGPVDVACLNAGVLGGPGRSGGDLARAATGGRSAVNVDGVVLGVQAPRAGHAGGRADRRRPRRSRASPRCPDDPVYAADEARGRRLRPQRRAGARASRASQINAVCPGIRRHGDGRLARRERRSRPSGFRLLIASRGRRGRVDWRWTCGRDGARRCVGRPASSPAALRSTSAFRSLPGPRARRRGARSGALRRCRPDARRHHATRRKARYEKAQPSPSANDRRMRRATTMRWTSSGPS